MVSNSDHPLMKPLLTALQYTPIIETLALQPKSKHTHRIEWFVNSAQSERTMDVTIGRWLTYNVNKVLSAFEFIKRSKHWTTVDTPQSRTQPSWNIIMYNNVLNWV